MTVMRMMMNKNDDFQNYTCRNTRYPNIQNLKTSKLQNCKTSKLPNFKTSTDANYDDTDNEKIIMMTSKNINETKLN